MTATVPPRWRDPFPGRGAAAWFPARTAGTGDAARFAALAAGTGTGDAARFAALAAGTGTGDAAR
jgi:hypothetical protein